MISLFEKYLLLISLPLYSLVILTEVVMSNWQMKAFYSVKEFIMNFYMTVVNAGIDLLFRGVYLIALFFIYELSPAETALNPITYWVLLFLLEDLAFYVEHRMDHSTRILWAVHVTHHSSPEFNLSTGFRSSVLQPLYRFIYFLPIAFLGFDPVDILFMYSLTQVYGVLVHTQYINKMPSWFEAFFVSPSHHRVHHASNVLYLDKNMGMVLIIWDKLFGTFQPEVPEEPVKFGITTMPDHPYHPIKGITHEFKNIGQDLSKDIPWKAKLGYVFMPPGWSHDGSTKTSRELQDELQTQKQLDNELKSIFKDRLLEESL